MGCEAFSTCYGFNCGGGAVEQTTLGYGGSGGLHPKCQIPPETFALSVGDWHGSISAVGQMTEIARQNLGCQHSNCRCPEDSCQCFGVDMGGNYNFKGNMSPQDCIDRGHCVNADMTVQGCCEDPYTGVKPTVIDGFGTGLDPKECKCRGGTWSSECKSPVPAGFEWVQEQLDSCYECKDGCSPYKFMVGDTWEYNKDCEGGNVAVDADGVRCCCDADSPKCDSCPNHCSVWSGTVENTCGPPVLFGPGGEGHGNGYGVTIPWEVVLVCTAPAKVAHGHKAYPPDYGAWILHVTAYIPNPDNRLLTDLCQEWTFYNTHGVGDLNIGSVCLGGTWDISVNIPLTSQEVKTSCKCGCPCDEQISNVSAGTICDCSNPDCQTHGGTFPCVDGTDDPPDCDPSCYSLAGRCPNADAIVASGNTSDYCTGGGGGQSGGGGLPGDPGSGGGDGGGEVMGNVKDEELCGKCCEPCTAACGDGCVCTPEDSMTGASSVCGTKTLSYINNGGHGASKAPLPTFVNDPVHPEGFCCSSGYGDGLNCIETAFYECGCISEEQVASGYITLTLKANTNSSHPTVTDVSGSEDGVPVGSDEPGTIIGECPAVDAICDLSNKHPTTDGCLYTQWPDSSCASPLPAPNHEEGVRCPNSLVWEQPVYGKQCVLPGGSNNGYENADFFPKNVQQCLSAHIDGSHWHLRPQLAHPNLWDWCPKTGYGEDPGACMDPPDPEAECVHHPKKTLFIADLGNDHDVIRECNIYCEGWWEVVVDCYRAWELDLCVACLGDCWTDRKIMGAVPWCGPGGGQCGPGGGQCDEGDRSASWGCDKKWPGTFPFLYYHPPEPEFCPYGEYFPAVGCPNVLNSPAAAISGGSGQLFYPGNINTRWSSCCGNQPSGCECCYPCGHPAYDPECRVRALVAGNICDICWECMCSSSTGDNANQVYKSNGCPNGCASASNAKATGSCIQVVQDGGNEIAGCGQFMQEMPDGQCPAPIYCPEGLIPYSKYGGGFCIEGDTCCQCLREKGSWETSPGVGPMIGPTTNKLGWKLGAPIMYDMAWYPLKEAVCLLEPCGMGMAGEGEEQSPSGPVIVDQGSLKVSVTLMNPGTSTEVGESVEMYDHQSAGYIIGVTGKGKPIKITVRLQQGQTQVNLYPGDPVFIGEMVDTQGFYAGASPATTSWEKSFGSRVGGNPAANGQFVVLAISGNEFTIGLPGGGPVIGDGDYTGGGTWHYYNPNDIGASCTSPSRACAYNFEFLDQAQVNVGTSPKVLPESLFVECIEEAFAEWSNIIESLWSPRADYTSVDRRHGSWGGGTKLFPGSGNINPGYDPLGQSNEQTNSHQLRFRFINLGHEPDLSNEVPSNKIDRYNVPEWSNINSYPEIGRCVTNLPGGDTAGGVVPESKWDNMASCVTNGHCYAKGCSANDMRSTSVQLSSNNKCEEIPHAAGPAGTGIMYNSAKDCLSAKYYACLTHPKNQVVRYISGEQFGNPVDSDLDGVADLFPAVPSRWYLDPKYVREDIGDENCCNHVDGYWELIQGDWSVDFGSGLGIFDPGFSELFPCVPKSAGCCQGTVSCVSPAGDHFLTPTNTYVPSTCCKEYETKYGQCLGDYNLDGEMDVMAGCDYDCCGYGYAGWCVNRYDFNDIYWSTESCPGCGGKDACKKGNAGVGCIETLSTCGDGKPTAFGTDAQTCGPVRWQSTQRTLKSDISNSNPSFEVSLRFPGGNVGDPIQHTDCGNLPASMFEVGDFIKIDNEYMSVIGLNTTTNTLSVGRGVSNSDADPTSSIANSHSKDASIYLWSSSTNCAEMANCIDNDGHLIGDANNAIGYFPIDNRSLYHLCRDGDRRSVYSDTCGTGGSCWIEGEGGAGSSRGVPIGISSLYNNIDSAEMVITITEVDNTGNLFVDAGNDTHNPSIIATPEKFKLKAGDIIRIESENMKVISVVETDNFHVDVKGKCQMDAQLNGLFGAPTNNVPECGFVNCDGEDRITDCRHWYGNSFDSATGWSNCAGEPLGKRAWPDKIVTLYEVTVARGEDGTSAVDHEANKWVRKKYDDIISDCRQCEDNLMGVFYRHKWHGTGRSGQTNPADSVWRPALWYPDFDWQANTWELPSGATKADMPFRGKTGYECSEWPFKDQCCPRIGQVRVGMVNWHDALRERWANEGRGQCYDCNTGVIVGGQTTFGPNSVEFHGECLRYNEDKYNKFLIGSISESQEDCLSLNCRHTLNNCEGVCLNNQNQELLNYTTKQDCISNNQIWATWDWSAYVNKDVCNNAGHCWDYREPPLVMASGNPFACGYMGSTHCRKSVDGVWVPCIPKADRPYLNANNTIGQGEGDRSCGGFQHTSWSHPIQTGADPDPDLGGGGEECICITQGREGIAGDLYIDSSVKWRPDWVPEVDKPGAYSIKRVLMKQIGHMLGLPEGGDVMSPIGGPADNAITVGASTYSKLVEMYEPRWWNRGGRNDYWWVSGVYAGDFK